MYINHLVQENVAQQLSLGCWASPFRPSHWAIGTIGGANVIVAEVLW